MMHIITKKGKIYKWNYTRLINNLFNVAIVVAFVVGFILMLIEDQPF